MRNSRLFAAGIATAVILVVLSGLSGSLLAQRHAAPVIAQVKPLGHPCNLMTDPFPGRLAEAELPPGLIPVDAKTRSDILTSGLPCAETVNPTGQTDNPKGVEATGLENLQRGFDFFSWLSFIALNSPADGKTIDQSQPNTPTRWEDMDNFKQLLDIMLPAKMLPPKWPTDKSEMEAEKVRLMPPACRARYKPGMMVVKMIEESFNEPFKTGPLIDQQGHYAIFDILMNRTMFDYISEKNLFTKAGQKSAANFSLAVDFPPGRKPPKGQTDGGDPGAVMLKVSWKILEPHEVRAKNFHMVNALVSMPQPSDPKVNPPCLPRTLGLTGFHLVHKTASRPQWIWTSFEHIKNVPDKDEVAAREFHGPYNFYDVNCKNNCPVVNATPPRPWDPEPALQLKFRKADSFKSQIVREIPLTHAARNMNTVFHSMLKGTVWENYVLLSTQWPSDFGCTALHSQNSAVPAPQTDFQKQPDVNCSPAPTFLANSTLETYSQGDIPLASSSCIACHGNAVSFQTKPKAR